MLNLLNAIERKILFYKISNILWPIKKEELKKFLPLALLMFCTLFNYQILRNLKDSLIVSSVGAESISFLKLYIVVPAALIFTIAYIKILNYLDDRKTFYLINIFFISFFLIFAFFLYPNQHAIHPKSETIVLLVNEFPRLKWFILLSGKWSYSLVYVLAELWGSIMLSLLFWQFANKICTTQEAKRFYSMFGLLGNFGLILAGTFTRIFSHASPSVTITASFLTISVFCIFSILSYYFINTSVLIDSKYLKPELKIKNKKSKLSFKESMKLITSSKYLGLILLLIVCYGITINLVEGPWKAKVRELYPSQNEYLNFMGVYSQFMGLGSVVLFFFASNILRLFRWKTSALITPIIISITGLGFFGLCIFQSNSLIFGSVIVGSGPIIIAVLLGAIQNIVSKATKYSLFDSTKEMAYIPLENELKTKGKAAVDVIGGRFGKAGGALLQSSILIIFPNAAYSNLTTIIYITIIFSFFCFVWFFAVNKLSREYEIIKS